MDRPLLPTNNTRTIILLGLIIVGWLATIYIESCQPPAEFLGLIPQLDKVAHFVVFIILGFLVCSLSFKLNQKSSIALFFIPLFVMALCGIIEKGLHLFVPERAASIPDLLADMGGAIFSILQANFFARKLNKRRNNVKN